MNREQIIRMALEALESDPVSHLGLVHRKMAITALRQALVDADDTSQERVDEIVKDEHEPVAWANSLSGWTDFGPYRPHRKPSSPSAEWIPLYASPPKKELTCVCGAVWEGETMVHPPPKREWVGLTDEEIQDLGYLSEKFDASNSEWFDRWGFAQAIEAKLKEKNT